MMMNVTNSKFMDKRVNVYEICVHDFLRAVGSFNEFLHLRNVLATRCLCLSLFVSSTEGLGLLRLRLDSLYRL